MMYVFSRREHGAKTKKGMELAKEKGKLIGRPPLLREKERRRIMAMIRQGMSYAEIAVKFGVTRAAIYKINKATGRKEMSGETKFPVMTQGELKYEEFLAMREKGVSIADASEKLGVSKSFYSYYRYRDKNQKKKKKAKMRKETPSILTPVPTRSVAAVIPMPRARVMGGKVLMLIGNIDDLAEFASKYEGMF